MAWLPTRKGIQRHVQVYHQKDVIRDDIIKYSLEMPVMKWEGV